MPDDAGPVEIERARRSPEWGRTKTLLSNRTWRLENLYRILDADGRDIPFRMNPAQRAYFNRIWVRDIITKGRQIGFSTFIELMILDACLFRSGTAAGVVDETLKKARDKLDKIKFAYDRLPEELRAERKMVTRAAEELEWNNNSRVTAGTDYRGGTAQILHVSEFGAISVNTPERAKQIKNGSLPAVHANGWAVIESTAHGTQGEFFEMVRRAEKRQLEKAPLTGLDYRLHFYGWWMKAEYRLPNNLVVLSQEMRDYFARVAPVLLATYNVRLDADQQAWYAKMYADLGPVDMMAEFPTLPTELFFNSIEGAFFAVELNRARAEGRIGQPVPYDPSRRVSTCWDIGEDCTAIWWVQSDGVRHRWIDYWEEEGSSLQAAVGVVRRKENERGFIYEKHYGPHDLGNRDWAANAQTRYNTALGLGLKFEVVPRVEVKADGIEASRRMIGMSYFCSDRVALGVDRLENYRKVWNKTLGVFTAEPVHDMASHGSSAFEQYARAFRMPAERRSDRGDRPRGSAWAS